MAAPTFITLGPPGTCHEHALLSYMEFQGMGDARVELVRDFAEGLERVRESPDGFLVQCSSHPDVHIVTESYPQEVFVVDTFMFPAKEMGLIARADVERPRSLGVVAAAMGYQDLGRWETVVEEPANPVVAENLLAGRYDAGVTFVAFGEEHPESLRVLERYGEVDTTWLVYGHRRRYRGELIGHRIPWLFRGEPDPVPGHNPLGLDVAPEAHDGARADTATSPRMPPEAGVVDRDAYPDVTVGEGYAIGCLEDLGSEYGFRKVRKGLGVTAFGVNALVRQPGYETKWHYHDEQEELYFVHRGSIEMELGDGSTHLLGEGCFARVSASTIRKIKVLGPGDTVYVCAGGKDGYIGRDGRTPEGV